MTVSSAFTISRRTESFCFSRRRICIGECEWVPPLKSLRSARSRPESNRNVDETSRRFAPDVHRLGTMRGRLRDQVDLDRKSTRLNSSHSHISYAVFCLKKKR